MCRVHVSREILNARVLTSQPVKHNTMIAEFLLPKHDREAAIVPKGAARWLPDSDVAIIPCSPLRPDVPRISVIARAEGKVEALTANGFMVRDKLAHANVSDRADRGGTEHDITHRNS